MDESDPSQTPDLLDYLNLLWNPDPDSTLEEFYDLLKANDDVKLSREPTNPTDKKIDEIIVPESDDSQKYLKFFEWWLEFYNHQISQKYDSLTGLLNRDHWERTLRHRIARNEDFQGVLVADIDHFKKFNDKYGHSMGDKVLSAVGDVLKQVFSDNSFCIRYGGEELLVIYRHSEVSLKELAERFREEIKCKTHFEAQPETITVSIGVSSNSSETESIEKVIEQADLALYTSKRQGRDRTTCFAPYMRHREELSVWGFYRYLWDPDVAFGFTESEGEFFLYHQGQLFYYDWYDNNSRKISVPDEISGPQSIIYLESKLHYLDESGEVWCLEQGNWNAVKFQSLPRLVLLIKAQEKLLGVGLNNQIYQVNKDDPERVGSLPEDWRTLIYEGGLFAVEENLLFAVDSDDIKTALPDDYLDFCSGNGQLVMSSNAGNLYAFDKSVRHWKQLRLPEFLGRRIDARKIDRRGNNYLIQDANGRFFMASREQKSVPQEMNFKLSR